MKYNLTDGAKAAAQILHEKWLHNTDDQLWDFMCIKAGGKLSHQMLVSLTTQQRMSFKLQHLTELSDEGLIKFNGKNVVLLQSLQDAVKNDFERPQVSHSMTTVNNIVARDNATVQASATNTGDITALQSVNGEQLAEILSQKLGDSFLESNKNVVDALNDLKNATNENSQSKLGSVISELGRSLGHGANTATVVSAIASLIPYLH